MPIWEYCDKTYIKFYLSIIDCYLKKSISTEKNKRFSDKEQKIFTLPEKMGHFIMTFIVKKQNVNFTQYHLRLTAAVCHRGAEEILWMKRYIRS